MSQELINAAAVGDLATVTKLLEAGADVNFQGQCPMSFLVPASKNQYRGNITAISAAILTNNGR